MRNCSKNQRKLIQKIILFCNYNRMCIRDWFKPNIEPMNHIYISKSNILCNYKYLQSLKPNTDLFPVIKSNAYGQGIDQILQIDN